MDRHLTVILYADVAGYSRLTGADEERTHQDLNNGLNLLTSTVNKHDGKVVHEAGDAILAKFGSTIAALKCATDFQRTMANHNDARNDGEKLEFRIGINLGEVIEDRDDIYGDGVNIAARIEEIAEPGGVFISSSVFEQVAGKLDQAFDDLGHRTFKNISHPVHVYRVRLSNSPDVGNTKFFVRPPILVTGRCMCGEIRFEIDQPATGVGLCHCRMCQRFNSAPFSVWAAFPAEAVRFTMGEPKYYTSSLIAERGYCSDCGSSLTMRYYVPEQGDVLAILALTLDHPENFAPTRHMGIESKLPWLDLNDNLPRSRSSDLSSLRELWELVGLPNPDDWK